MPNSEFATPPEIPEPKLTHDSVWRKGLALVGLRSLSQLQGARKTIGIRDKMASIRLAQLASGGQTSSASNPGAAVGDDMGDSLQAGDNQNYTYNYHGAGVGKMASTALIAAVLGACAAGPIAGLIATWFADDATPAAEFEDTDTDTLYDLDFVE